METQNKKTPMKTYQRAFKHNEPLSVLRCHEISVDFKSVCRLCLQKTDYMSEILDDDCMVSTVVKIRTLLGIRVEEKDELPSLICDDCLVGLNEFYTFKKRCTENDVRLRQILLKMPPKNQTPTSHHSSHNLTLTEDIFDLNIKKNNCTIIWDDQVPLAGIIITEYENDQRHVFNSNRKIPIDGENAAKNHTGENVSILKDDEETPLAQRLASEEKNEKSRCEKIKYSTVRFCQCSKKSPACKHLKNHFVWKYKCAECSKVFRTLSLLHRHYPVHTGERPFVCYLCDCGFSQRYSLYRHMMQIHESVRPFKCQYCSKSYSLSHLLADHVKSSHTVKPKFRCSVCPKTFTHSSGLSRHKNFHNGKKYVCNICYKMFNDPSSLSRHSKACAKLVRNKSRYT